MEDLTIDQLTLLGSRRKQTSRKSISSCSGRCYQTSRKIANGKRTTKKIFWLDSI